MVFFSGVGWLEICEDLGTGGAGAAYAAVFVVAFNGSSVNRGVEPPVEGFFDGFDVDNIFCGGVGEVAGVETGVHVAIYKYFIVNFGGA